MNHSTNMPSTSSAETDSGAHEGLEISIASAMELCQLNLATMVDIRQAFEIEMKGAIPGSVHIPLFEVKLMLGHALSEDEQDILDAGEPTPIDVQSFFTTINKLHNVRSGIVLYVCNSGRRSLYAAQLLRSMGYDQALSVAGGFQAWRKLNLPVSSPSQTAVKQS